MNGAVKLAAAATALPVPTAAASGAGGDAFAALLPLLMSGGSGGEAAETPARRVLGCNVEKTKDSDASPLAVAAWLCAPAPLPTPLPAPSAVAMAAATSETSVAAPTATPVTTMTLLDAARTLAAAMPAAAMPTPAGTTRETATATADEPPAGTLAETGAPLPAPARPAGATSAPAATAVVPHKPVKARDGEEPEARPATAETPKQAPALVLPDFAPPTPAETAAASSAPVPADAPAPVPDDTAAADPTPHADTPIRIDAPVAVVTAPTAETRTPAPTAPVHHAPPPTPVVHSPQFGETFGAHVTWLAEQRTGEAQIRVSRDDLGPIDIRLRFDGDTIHADFGSAHAEVRAAIETQLPRLRELFSAQGLALAGAGVGHSFGDAPQRSQPAPVQRDESPTEALPAATAEEARTVHAGRGLFDAYA